MGSLRFACGSCSDPMPSSLREQDEKRVLLAPVVQAPAQAPAMVRSQALVPAMVSRLPLYFSIFSTSSKNVRRL